ncbi:Omp28-related outer membrane protein [Chryseobacterium sp. MEBOG06]|uniref:Omp28-related outer membrane protein n=1 Tax=Chryseobacterium sp. MEBOG06 TaxID=2879938 RepID=UPI001F1FD2BC|nr:Omp28-related outer membrane protein [Chryseobacterium sp. MEBOG06]UKB85655.1 Omp28-related outer membrane protein [Chryseobacterium sp. MEBOG06]
MKKSLLFLHSVIFIFLLLCSCKGNESDEGNSAVTYISVSSEGGNEKLLGKTFTFKVKDNLSSDVTSQSKIYVNNQLINGNTYTPLEKGTYNVKATYKDLPVNPISVNSVVNEGVAFKHRILYEDFTGTWCGYCTIALARHDNLSLQTGDYVFMGIHGPEGTTDPWANATSTEMEVLKNITEWPGMFINRNIVWVYDSNYTDMSLPLSQIKAYSRIGIKMNSTISGNKVNIEARVFFTENLDNLKIAAFIVEDELVHNQKNYIGTLYGGGSAIYNYTHHNVLRNKLGSVTGDPIPDSQTVISNEYIRSFQYNILSGFNPEHLKVIIMILDENGSVLNVREEKIGTNNSYEFL